MSNVDFVRLAAKDMLVKQCGEMVLVYPKKSWDIAVNRLVESFSPKVIDNIHKKYGSKS